MDRTIYRISKYYCSMLIVILLFEIIIQFRRILVRRFDIDNEDINIITGYDGREIHIAESLLRGEVV